MTENKSSIMQGTLDLMVLKAAMFCASHHRQRVANVEFSNEIGVELETGNFEFGCGRAVTNIKGFDSIVFAQTEALHRAMRYVQQFGKVEVITVG